jgi:phosphatidate cytidylyltransferase
MEAPGSGERERPPRPFDEGIELDFDLRPREEPSDRSSDASGQLAGRAAPRRVARPAPTRPGRSETLARIAWALPWIAFVITVIVVGGLPFALAVLGFAFIALSELFRMTREYRPLDIAAVVAAAGMIAAAYWGDHFQIVLAGAASFPLMFAIAVARRPREGITVSAAITTLGVIWIGLPLAHAVLLRELPEHGGALLVDVLVATFVADTSAYAIGRLFGRHPLAPGLSPNKTIEGLAGGLVGGTMGFWFAGLYQDWLPGLDALAMGACIAVLAPVGDLFESMVKRDLRVKDTGSVFGPHGGMLDRMDAVLFTLVAGYYLSVAFVY